MQVACEHVFGKRSLNGRRVLVQGAVSVGSALIEYLRSAGADVIFSDVEEKSICRFRDDFNLQCISAEKVYSEECDIFAPCALGGVLNRKTIPQLKCRGVAGGAMFLVGMETQNWSQEHMENEITCGIQNVLKQIFELSITKEITTEAAAHQVAEKRLSSVT